MNLPLKPPRPDKVRAAFPSVVAAAEVHARARGLEGQQSGGVTQQAATVISADIVTVGSAARRWCVAPACIVNHHASGTSMPPWQPTTRAELQNEGRSASVSSVWASE